MPVSLASDPEFAAPRTRFDIDIDEICARVPASVTTKGMFFNRCLALARELDEAALLQAAGLDDDRILPFGDYPWNGFVRLAAAVGEPLHGGRTAIGLRAVGRTLYDEFADSLPGRMTFGVLRYNADRVIGLGAKAWMMSGSPGRVVSESVGDQHYRYRYLGYPAEVTETLAIGVLESALHSCGEVAQLGFARLDEMNAIVDIRWG